MNHDVPPGGWSVLLWVALVWSAAAAGFLVARPLFRDWADQGYALSRLTGPLLVGLVTWLLTAVGGRPLTMPVVAVAMATVIAAAGLVARRSHTPPPPARLLTRTELLTAATFVGFALVRSWSPSIEGTERPMDHALLAAMLAQQTPLPVDPWLAGHQVNYHAAGYAWWAPFAVLTQQPPWASYNFIVSTLPAQLAAGAWGIGHRLRTGWAWVTPTALVLAGPLTAMDLVLRERRLPAGLEPTRTLPGTINEFPFFSLTWGDLHPHVIAMPLLVLLAALLLRLDEVTHDAAQRRLVVPLVALTGAVATACVLTSSWDVAPGLVGACWTLALLGRRVPRLLPLACATAAAVALLLAWPVVQTFRPPAVPVGWEWEASPPVRFVLVLGTWLLPAVIVALGGRWSAGWTTACAAVASTVALAAGFEVRALLALVAFGVWRRRMTLGMPATALVLSALGLLLLAESVWVDDVYGWPLRRMNVVFKLHLHAIVLLSLAMPAVVHVLWTEPRPGMRRWTHVALAVLAGGAVVASAVVLAARWREREPATSLNGLAALERRWPGDAAAIRYLWQHAQPEDVVLEAAGRSYSYRSRISFMTGQPTLLGWLEHERLWRRGDSWDAELAARTADIQALYDGPVDGLGPRLAAAAVRYVVVGPVERRTYPALTARRFADVADVVFDEQDTVLLRVR